MSTTKKLIDEQVAKLGYVSLWGVHKERRMLPKIIDEDEEVIGLLRVFTSATIVLLVATQKRLFILDRRAFYGSDNKEISYLQIANVRFETGLFFGQLIIDDQGEDHCFGWAYKRELRRFCNILGDQVSEFREKSVQADEQYLSTADELKKLWDLKEAGAITVDEFKAQKKRLLLR
ncbi:MAG: PH domain-containing protein [bacterium]|nr:PH domain-containing protein [bacterium]